MSSHNTSTLAYQLGGQWSQSCWLKYAHMSRTSYFKLLWWVFEIFAARIHILRFERTNVLFAVSHTHIVCCKWYSRIFGINVVVKHRLKWGMTNKTLFTPLYHYSLFCGSTSIKVICLAVTAEQMQWTHIPMAHSVAVLHAGVAEVQWPWPQPPSRSWGP